MPTKLSALIAYHGFRVDKSAAYIYELCREIMMLANEEMEKKRWCAIVEKP